MTYVGLCMLALACLMQSAAGATPVAAVPPPVPQSRGQPGRGTSTRPDTLTAGAGRVLESGVPARAPWAGPATAPSCTHKVLVIMSSASELTLQNGIKVPIGYYFDELAIPLQSFVEQGWNATFVNPLGNTPVMDKRSDRPFYFAPLNPELAQRRFDSAKALLAAQPTLQSPIRFADMTNARLDAEDFDILFVPGGHAPMVDLWNNAELGRILVHFLDAKKPISALCHGPVALLSAGLVRQPWPFAGRNLTVFSTAGEKIDEKRWGGLVPFYPSQKMAAAGGIMHIRGPPPYMPNVIRDLVANQSTVVTGQNPFSAGDVAAFQVDELLSRCGVAASMGAR